MLEDTSVSGEKDIVITSGTFSSDVGKKFLAPGAKKEGNEGTGFTVGADYVAMIGETGYISLASAIESVQDSQTIKLVDDVTPA